MKFIIALLMFTATSARILSLKEISELSDEMICAKLPDTRCPVKIYQLTLRCQSLSVGRKKKMLCPESRTMVVQLECHPSKGPNWVVSRNGVCERMERLVVHPEGRCNIPGVGTLEHMQIWLRTKKCPAGQKGELTDPWICRNGHASACTGAEMAKGGVCERFKAKHSCYGEKSCQVEAIKYGKWYYKGYEIAGLVKHGTKVSVQFVGMLSGKESLTSTEGYCENLDKLVCSDGTWMTWYMDGDAEHRDFAPANKQCFWKGKCSGNVEKSELKDIPRYTVADIPAGKNDPDNLDFWCREENSLCRKGTLLQPICAPKPKRYNPTIPCKFFNSLGTCGAGKYCMDTTTATWPQAHFYCFLKH